MKSWQINAAVFYSPKRARSCSRFANVNLIHASEREALLLFKLPRQLRGGRSRTIVELQSGNDVPNGLARSFQFPADAAVPAICLSVSVNAPLLFRPPGPPSCFTRLLLQSLVLLRVHAFNTLAFCSTPFLAHDRELLARQDNSTRLFQGLILGSWPSQQL